MHALFLLTLVVAISVSCARERPAPSAAPPPPVFTSLSVNYLGHSIAIDAGGFHEYVQSYGRAGWICGLRDTRSALQAMGVTEAKRQRQGGEGDSELRVKDVFCFYYLHEHAGTGKDIHWIPDASQSERNVLIGQVIKRIEEEEGDP